MARPTKYKKEFCEKLVKHLSDGFSFESFAGLVDVCEDTIYEWCNKHPEFSEAKKRGYAKNRLWWETQGNGNLLTDKNKSFNSTVWIFNMKNRHGWRDKKEVEIPNANVNLNYKLVEDDE